MGTWLNQNIEYNKEAESRKCIILPRKQSSDILKIPTLRSNFQSYEEIYMNISGLELGPVGSKILVYQKRSILGSLSLICSKNTNMRDIAQKFHRINDP